MQNGPKTIENGPKIVENGLETIQNGRRYAARAPTIMCPQPYPLWKKKSHKPKTLNGRLPLEDSSDFDDFWTEFIVMTRSFI